MALNAQYSHLMQSFIHSVHACLEVMNTVNAVNVIFKIQWILQTKDNLGSGPVSFIQSLSFFGRFTISRVVPEDNQY